MTPLALALITGHHEAAAKLVALGADANAGDKEGVAPAHRAAGHGDMDALELLVVKGGADLETQSGAGTPLHWAAGEVRERRTKFQVPSTMLFVYLFVCFSISVDGAMSPSTARNVTRPT